MEESREESRDTSLFGVGDRFSSYKELEERIKVYEEANFIQLGHQDSRTLEDAKKRTLKGVENANKDLKYYSLCLSCNYGSKKIPPKKYRPEKVAKVGITSYIVQILV